MVSEFYFITSKQSRQINFFKETNKMFLFVSLLKNICLDVSYFALIFGKMEEPECLEVAGSCLPYTGIKVESMNLPLPNIALISPKILNFPCHTYNCEAK